MRFVFYFARVLIAAWLLTWPCTSAFATMKVSSESKLGHLILNGLARVLHIGAPAPCEDAVCASLKSTSFTSKDVLKLIEHSPLGKTLIRSVSPPPVVSYYEDLPASQRNKIDLNSDGYGEAAAAVSVPIGLIGNTTPVVVIHKDLPLFAAAIMISHEFQHAADFGTKWNQSMHQVTADDLKPVPGVVNTAAVDQIETGYALQDLHTYVFEYRAFSADSEVRRELQRIYPCFSRLWKDFVHSSGIPDLDPANSKADRIAMVRAYIDSGNYGRILARGRDIDNSPEIASVLRASGVSFNEFVDAVRKADREIPKGLPPSSLR